MSRDKVLKIVTNIGDSYRIKTVFEDEPFDFYVSCIGLGVLIQDAPDLDYRVVTYSSIEWVEAY